MVPLRAKDSETILDDNMNAKVMVQTEGWCGDPAALPIMSTLPCYRTQQLAADRQISYASSLVKCFIVRRY
jgi:hypothetical protein